MAFVVASLGVMERAGTVGAAPRAAGAAPRAAGAVPRAAGKLRQAMALVKMAVALCAPEDTCEAEATELAQLLGDLEKLASACALRYSLKAGRRAPGLLAGVSGTAPATARRRIQALEALEKAPRVAAAFQRGELSMDQAQVIAPVALGSPDDAGRLSDQVRLGTSLKELRSEAERVLRRHRREEDARAAEMRLHARRYCRLYRAEGGGLRIDALLGGADGALVMAALDKEADACFEELHRAGQVGTRDHLLADALVGLLCRSARTKGAHVVVRVDARALRGGEVGRGEVCEIDGVGPVSVETARRLLGEGFLTLLVTSGRDITTVTSTSRAVRRRIDVALQARDPVCVVPGCGSAKGLERHHWRLDFSTGGPTELDNLCRLCRPHHAMATKEGWKISGGPGRWRFHRPRPVPRT